MSNWGDIWYLLYQACAGNGRHYYTPWTVTRQWVLNDGDQFQIFIDSIYPDKDGFLYQEMHNETKVSQNWFKENSRKLLLSTNISLILAPMEPGRGLFARKILPSSGFILSVHKEALLRDIWHLSQNFWHVSVMKSSFG